MKKLLFIIFLLFFSVNLYSFSLKEGFKLALQNDMDSKVNENNLHNIKYDQDIADSLYKPTLDLTGKIEKSNTTSQRLTPKGKFSKTDEYELEFRQPLFDGFEHKYEKKLQISKYKSAVYFLKESHESVALDYTQSYINVLREKDLLNLNKEKITIYEDIYNKVSKKIDSGFGTKLEFEKAKADFSESKVDYGTQKLNLKDAIENLKFYVQEDFDSSELIKPALYVKLPKSLSEATKTALKENPTINVAKVNVQVAVAQQRKANKDFYPTVDFVTNYKINNGLFKEEDTDSNDFTVGIELNYNLYNGGKNVAEVKKALQNIKEKQYLIRKSEYQVKNKLRLAWNSYKLNNEKRKSLEQYALVKKDVLEATNKEFDLGLQTFDSLHDAYDEYIDVKRDLISNYYDLLYAKFRVLNSLGKLSDELLHSDVTSQKIQDRSKIFNDIYEETSYDYKSGELLNEKKLKKIDIKQENKNLDLKYDKSKKTKDLSLSFKEKFLNASADKYTINLALSNSEKKAKKFIKNNNLEDEAFYFSFKKEHPLQKIMMGIYNSKKEAKETISLLSKNLKKNNPRIEKISIKQKLYFKYHGKLNIKNKTTKLATVSFKTNVASIGNFAKIKKQKISFLSTKKIDFKDKFLKASPKKYTINLALAYSKDKAQNFINKNNISKNAFYFQFGYDKPLQKIMYGIFDTKEEARNALKNFSKTLKRNKPRIEKIEKKQKLFHKYNKYAFSSQRIRSI